MYTVVAAIMQAVTYVYTLSSYTQQEYVLSELQEYASQSPPPPDAASVQKTVQYLQACNKLFERGILGKRVFIKSTQSPILTGMEEGFKFFTAWLDQKLSEGMYNYSLNRNRLLA